MPKQSLKTARPDRSKISMQNEVEVKYWMRHLGITRKRLQIVVEKVGNSAASVRKELRRTQTNSDAE
jgi:hypothetical protein